MTNIVDQSKHKLHDVLRCCLTVIQFHTPEKKLLKKHLHELYSLLGPCTISGTCTCKYAILYVQQFLNVEYLLHSYMYIQSPF